MYEFEYPWVFALLPLPLLAWWLLPAFRTDQDALRIPFFERIAQATGLKPSEGAVVLRTTWLQKLIAPVCWTLLVVALARPQRVEPPVQKVQPARDLMLALDISGSMATSDGGGIRRVDAVKRAASDFIRKREGDRIGLILFGAAAYPQAPFTLDHDACLMLLDQTDTGMAGPQTMIGDAIGLAIKLFDRSKAEERVMILLSDGNDTGSRMPPAKAAQIAKQRGITIHTIGVGDPKATGADKVDFSTLESVAHATGGRFFQGTGVEQLTEIYSTLDRITPQNFKTLSYRPKDPLYMYPLGVAVSLLLVFYLYSFSRLGISRRRAA